MSLVVVVKLLISSRRVSRKYDRISKGYDLPEKGDECKWTNP